MPVRRRAARSSTEQPCGVRRIAREGISDLGMVPPPVREVASTMSTAGTMFSGRAARIASARVRRSAMGVERKVRVGRSGGLEPLQWR